jgi:Polyketide cyclase / dehydrase and lipid transport
MISIIETTRLPHEPERVWRFFTDEVEMLYPDWHPEHVSWRWLRGQPLAQGTVWHAHERVGRLRISGRFKVRQAESARFFSYTLGFPSSRVRAGGSFRLEALPPGDCELIQDVHLGFATPVLARLLDPIIALAVPLRELRRHMREEQANLTTLLATTP